MNRTEIIDHITQLLGASGNRRLATSIYVQLRKLGLIQNHGRLGLWLSPEMPLTQWLEVVQHARVRVARPQ